MRSIRESASIIMTARHVQKCIRQPPPVNFQYNYDLLCLKRQQNSKFMPSAYVFPGGVIEPFDADPKWHNLFSVFGFDKNSFSSLMPDVKTRPSIFKQHRNELPREISLRITAIREAFEECGILLCRRSNDGGTHSDWAQHIEMSMDDIHSWQTRVHNDATEFYSLCKHFDCYPDLWALYEWSNWLTPTSYRNYRFDTVFYMACMQNTPQTHFETSEIEDLKGLLSKSGHIQSIACFEHHADTIVPAFCSYRMIAGYDRYGLEWDLPANFIFSTEGITLPPPQQYEIARISKFESVDNLLDFAIDRTKRGVLQILPVKVKLRDGNVYVLPGDSMYPIQVNLIEEQIIQKPDITIEQFQDISAVKNRIEFYNCEVRKLFVQNFDNEDGHLAPMQLEDVHVIQNQKH